MTHDHYGTIKSEMETIIEKQRTHSELGDGDLRHLQGFLLKERQNNLNAGREPFPTSIPNAYLGLLSQSEAVSLYPETMYYFEKKTDWAAEIVKPAPNEQG